MIGTLTTASLTLGRDSGFTSTIALDKFSDLSVTEVECYGQTATVRVYNNLADDGENLLADTCALWSDGSLGPIDVGMFVRIEDDGGDVGVFLITSMDCDDDIVDLTLGDYIQVLRATGYDYVRNHYAGGAYQTKDFAASWNGSNLCIDLPSGVTAYGGDYGDVTWNKNAELELGDIDEASELGYATEQVLFKLKNSTFSALTSLTISGGIGWTDWSAPVTISVYDGSMKACVVETTVGLGFGSELEVSLLTDGCPTSVSSSRIYIGFTPGSGSSEVFAIYGTSSDDWELTWPDGGEDGAVFCGTLSGTVATTAVVGETSDGQFVISTIDGEAGAEDDLEPNEEWDKRASVSYIDPASSVTMDSVFSDVVSAAGGSVDGIASMREVNVFRCNLAEYHDYLLALADMTEPEYGSTVYGTADEPLSSLTVASSSFSSYLGSTVHLSSGAYVRMSFSSSTYTYADGSDELTYGASLSRVYGYLEEPGQYTAWWTDADGNSYSIRFIVHALDPLECGAGDLVQGKTYYTSVGAEVSVSAETVDDIEYSILSVSDGFGLTVSSGSLTGTLTAEGVVVVVVRNETEEATYEVDLCVLEPYRYIDSTEDRQHAFACDPSSWSIVNMGFRHVASDSSAGDLRYGGDSGDHSIPVVSFAPSKSLQYRSASAVAAGTREDGSPIIVVVRDPAVAVGSQTLIADSSSTTDVEAALTAYSEVVTNRSTDWEGTITLSGIRRGFFTRSGQAVGGVPVRLYDSRYGMDGYEARVREAVYDFASQKTTLTLNNCSEAYANSILDSSRMAYSAGTFALEAGSSDLFVRQFAYVEAGVEGPSKVSSVYAWIYDDAGTSVASYVAASTVSDISFPELGVRAVTAYWPVGSGNATAQYAVQKLSVNGSSGSDYVHDIPTERRPDFYATNSLVAEIVYYLEE